MYKVIGCLGTTVADVDSIDLAINAVLSQVQAGAKKVRTMRNALSKLQQGQEYHVEYGGSGCTVRRL